MFRVAQVNENSSIRTVLLESDSALVELLCSEYRLNWIALKQSFARITRVNNSIIIFRLCLSPELFSFVINNHISRFRSFVLANVREQKHDITLDRLLVKGHKMHHCQHIMDLRETRDRQSDDVGSDEGVWMIRGVNEHAGMISRHFRSDVSATVDDLENLFRLLFICSDSFLFARRRTRTSTAKTTRQIMRYCSILIDTFIITVRYWCPNLDSSRLNHSAAVRREVTVIVQRWSNAIFLSSQLLRSI